AVMTPSGHSAHTTLRWNVVSSRRCMNDPQPEGHMASYIERRKFLATLGGAAAAWPLAARAQRPAMPVVGILQAGWAETNPNTASAFRKGLSETGYLDGQTVAIEYRWAEGQYDQLQKPAAELVRRRVAVIITPLSTAATLAAKATTTTIPIVFSIGSD